MASQVPRLSASKFGVLPPRSTTWASGLPVVWITDAVPAGSMPRNVCGWRADSMALTATARVPSVEFLNPTGMERPLAISRCVWLSVVRAPPADGGRAEQVGDVRGHDGIQQLGARRKSEPRDVEQQLSREAQAELHVVGTVQVRIADQALPADRGARLLEVDPHDDEQRVLDLAGEPGEPACVVDGRLGGVDRARSHHREQPAVLSPQDAPNPLSPP